MLVPPYLSILSGLTDICFITNTRTEECGLLLLSFNSCFIFLVAYFIRILNFFINRFEKASFLGQYDISTKNTFFEISNNLGGIIKPSILLDF